MRMSDKEIDATSWWKGATIYMVYIRSFKDGNGDGIGDLAGLIEKVDYIASLGVDAVWISPFFVSPMKDFGYDVADFVDVDPIFGTLADFDAVLARFHERGIKVLLDLVVSHTSDRHPWFIESRADRTNAKADWFVWADAKPDGSPPNNWLSVFGGSAWQWDAQRKQYYLHNFLKSQPDLNHHNADVLDELLAVFEFWLKRCVDGFRLDTVNFYAHDRKLPDNPPVPSDIAISTVPLSNPYGFQLHLHDKNQPENLHFLERLRALVKRYGDAVLLGELGVDEDVPGWTRRYTEAGKRLHMTYTFQLLGSDGVDAAFIRDVALAMDRGLDDAGWTAWAISSLDVERVISRWGFEDVPDRAAVLLMAITACLRGTAVYYQGEELGFPDGAIAFEDLQDPYGMEFWPAYKGRDGNRSPIAWTSQEPFGGFSDRKPWLPVDARHIARSVARQENEPMSSLNRVRRFLAWRKSQPALRVGTVRFLNAPPSVLALVRETRDDAVAGLFNIGRQEVEVSAPELAAATALDGHGFSGTSEDGRVRLGPLDAALLRLRSAPRP